MVKEEAMKDNSSGVAGVVLGVVGIASGGLVGWMGILLGIVGLCFSLSQKKHGKNKWSKAGYILNIISIVLGVIAIVFVIYLTKHPELINGAGAA